MTASLLPRNFGSRWTGMPSRTVSTAWAITHLKHRMKRQPPPKSRPSTSLLLPQTPRAETTKSRQRNAERANSPANRLRTAQDRCHALPQSAASRTRPGKEKAYGRLTRYTPTSSARQNTEYSAGRPQTSSFCRKRGSIRSRQKPTRSGDSTTWAGARTWHWPPPPLLEPRRLGLLC